MIHGRRDRADYDALEQVYHDKLEAKNMLETAIARERALIFAQGKAEGEAIGSANFLISLLEKRFGPLTPAQQQQLHALETPTLLTLAERLWNAQSLEEVLNGIEE